MHICPRLLKHDRYDMLREKKAFGMGEFAGEFGGTAGLLLGLSIWAYYNDVVDLVLLCFARHGRQKCF